MANRQMAFQWALPKIVEKMEGLNSFIKLSGVDENLDRLEEAMTRCKLSDATKRDHRISVEIAKILQEKRFGLDKLRLVIGWRNPDVTDSVTLQVEYIGRVPVSAFTVSTS